MATEHDFNKVSAEVGYERQDLSHRGILVFFSFLFIAGVVIHVAIWAMYLGFEKYAASTEPPRSPLIPNQRPVKAGMLQNTAMIDLQKFGTPRLQSNDVFDMETFRLVEEKVLNAGAYEENGVVHMPIDAAMQVLAQRGIPARANATDPSSYNPATVPTEAGFPGSQNMIQSTIESGGGEGAVAPPQPGTGAAVEGPHTPH